MDLRQKRLTAEEWDALEVPVSKDELRILKLIHDGFNDVNITDNDTMSLINFVKINTEKKDDIINSFTINISYKPLKNYLKNLIFRIREQKKRQRKLKLKKLMKFALIIRIKN